MSDNSALWRALYELFCTREGQRDLLLGSVLALVLWAVAYAAMSIPD